MARSSSAPRVRSWDVRHTVLPPHFQAAPLLVFRLAVRLAGQPRHPLPGNPANVPPAPSLQEQLQRGIPPARQRLPRTSQHAGREVPQRPNRRLRHARPPLHRPRPRTSCPRIRHQIPHDSPCSRACATRGSRASSTVRGRAGRAWQACGAWKSGGGARAGRSPEGTTCAAETYCAGSTRGTEEKPTAQQKAAARLQWTDHPITR